MVVIMEEGLLALQEQATLLSEGVDEAICTHCVCISQLCCTNPQWLTVSRPVWNRKPDIPVRYSSVRVRPRYRFSVRRLVCVQVCATAPSQTASGEHWK